MSDKEKSGLMLSDYAKKRGLDEEAVLAATDAAFGAMINYQDTISLINGQAGPQDAATIAELSTERDAALREFERLVTAKPCLVDFHAVYRAVDNRAEKPEDVTIDYTLLHEMAMSRIDMTPFMKILLKAGMPVDCYFTALTEGTGADRIHAYVPGTPLMVAVKHERYPHAEFFFQQGASPDVQESGFDHRPLLSKTPLVYFAITKPDTEALEFFLKHGANILAPQSEETLVPETHETVHDYLVSRKIHERFRNTVALVEHYLNAAQQAAAKHLVPNPDPMSLTREDVYLLCNIGKTEELFTQPCWQEPKAAKHALELIDGLIPYQMQRFLIVRTELEPFAEAAPDPHIQGAVGLGNIAASQAAGGSRAT